MIALLLRLYPANWRAEYGPELASILTDHSLTVRIIADTTWSGVRERIRATAPWAVTGTLLLASNLCLLAINSVVPIPPMIYSGYEYLTSIALIMAVCWTALRGASLRQSLIAGWKASALSNSPELLLLLLWITGIVHPMIINLNGTLLKPAHGIAMLSIRSTVPMDPVELTWQLPGFFFLVCTGMGLFGWTLARFILRVRPLFAR